MGRYNEFAKVTPAALRSLAASIRALADGHDKLAGWMETDKIESVDAGLMKTEVDSLVGHCKFLAAVFEAYQEVGCLDGISQMAGAVAHFKAQTGRIREAVRLAFFEEMEANEKMLSEMAHKAVEGAPTKSKSVKRQGG